jgi:prepilin-type N-terminal cleavage/methylation domain-containing protein
MNTARKRIQQGFTLAELLVSSVVFLVMAAGAFSLVNSSSRRFKTDSQVLTSFQEARLGIDQIVRDVEDAGFPPRSRFSTAAPLANLYAASPFAWAPNYPNPCTVGGTCTNPSGFDLIVETDYDGTGVKWIRYQLLAGQTTLTRAVVPKVAGADPDASTSVAAVLLPYIQNVMNNATAAQITQIQADYPAMFPGGNPVPVFTYTQFDPPTSALVGGCTSTASTPCNIRDVSITLIVQAISRDTNTQALRLVELNGLAHRVNPGQ